MEENLFSILRKSLIFASLVSGIYFIFLAFTRPSVTGAVIGPGPADFTVIMGILLLLISLTLSFHHDVRFKRFIKAKRNTLEENSQP